jgi:SP family general alpha glucoside:H+ symporter-like MFS transporter
MMEHTDMMEKARIEGTSYMDCFRGTNLRRTEIASCAWLTQVLTGTGLSVYSTYFYIQAGLRTQHAFTLTLVQSALGAIGTGCSWALMSRFGRRTLYLWGIAGLCFLMLTTGLVAACAPNPSTNAAAGWATGSLLIAWTALYDATVGPVCYALVSELPSTRLRAKTVVIARCCYNAAFIVVLVLSPRMLNPTAWNWGGKAAFVWAGFALLCFVWTFFRLPEPKGRTYGELDVLFARGTPARKFASTVVEIVDDGNVVVKKMAKPMVEMVE